METYYEHELLRMYIDFLDDIYGTVEVAGLEYNTSHVLENVDEIAFRCGFNDWLDGEGYDEVTVDGELKWTKE